MGTTSIAEQLSAEKVLIPSAYAANYFPENCRHNKMADPCRWTATTVGFILDRQEYLGHTVLNSPSKSRQWVFAMPRKYSHIQEHEKEIVELRSQGMTLRQIGEKLGFTYKEMREFLTRYNREQKKLASGIPPKPKGQPKKTTLDPSSIDYYKAENERLKMENELLRDFLQFAERE